jgi:hypothetical protein
MPLTEPRCVLFALRRGEMGTRIEEVSVTNLLVNGINAKPGGGSTGNNEAWQLVALYEILMELRKLNALLHCSNFVGMPTTLRQIRANTAKPREAKDKKA